MWSICVGIVLMVSLPLRGILTRLRATIMIAPAVASSAAQRVLLLVVILIGWPKGRPVVVVVVVVTVGSFGFWISRNFDFL